MQPTIVIDREYVLIEGVKVSRPSGHSPSQWLDFWNDAVAAKDVVNENEDELEKLEKENKKLNDSVDQKNDEIKLLENRLNDIRLLASS